MGFIEAHGTGTQLGDPLEVHALGSVFGQDRGGVAPLVIGSVKTNIGHLEGAAGVTGLIKLVLALRHRCIPRHLHFATPSPHIHWSDYPLTVPREAMDWQPIDGVRIGGVSSFGFSGTNAHVIVEEAPHPAGEVAPARRARLFTLSARDPHALAEWARRHREALAGRSDDDRRHLLHRQPRPCAASLPCRHPLRVAGRTAGRRPRSRRGAKRRSCARRIWSGAIRRGWLFCSPGRAHSTPAWAGSCTRPSPCSGRPSTAAPPASPRAWRCRSAISCSAQRPTIRGWT
ncbi:polyketide synthase [Piscinibacter aquaticus]|uniref:Polyketide synthase n=1 Tax=Piscinibacter aquaticus TaxID=392597 RepID=A0A5C6U2B7_9BURK|nr:polyketide synthase [Piscinibacter aquaticus]